MPRTASTRTQTNNKTQAPARTAGGGNRTTQRTQQQQAISKPNGTGRRGNGRRPETTFWPLDLVSVVYLAANNGEKDLDITACGRCAALLVDTPSSQKAHKQFHDLIDGLDAAVVR